MNIGEALKGIRKSHKIKQLVAARDLKITQPYLSRIESNDKEPSTELIKRIGAYYGVPFAVMLWKTIEPSDIRADKRDLFTHLKPLVDSLVNQLF